MKKLYPLILCLAACGFTPLYSSRDPEFAANIASIYVEPIDGVNGIKLRNRLEDNLLKSGGSQQAALYTLNVKISSRERYLGIRSDEIATLISSTYTAKVVLTERANNKVLMTDSFSAATSRNVLSDPYSTIVSQEAGEERVFKILADDIATKLTLFFKNIDISPDKDAI